MTEGPPPVGTPSTDSDGVDPADVPEAPTPSGFHHVSTVVGDPFENRQFHTAVLGLRLVKRTVNFDEPHVHHLYYGDDAGTPGATVTCFPFPLDEGGRVGTGQPVEVSLAVPPGSLAYWTDRFTDLDVDHDEVEERFGRPVLPFRDPDGTNYALVEVDDGDRALDRFEPWSGSDVPADRAVHGIYGATLDSANVWVTAALLEVFGFDLAAQEDDRVRYVLDADGEAGTDGDAVDAGTAPAGTVVDLLDRETDWGKEGAGTVHHVAFTVPDEDALHAWRERLSAAGAEPSYVKDRHYFSSVYVRDPGGLLFELATPEPGLTVDEPRQRLGSELRLPPWLEADREMIRHQLPPLDEPTTRPHPNREPTADEPAEADR